VPQCHKLCINLTGSLLQAAKLQLLCTFCIILDLYLVHVLGLRILYYALPTFRMVSFVDPGVKV
jgi:hypothetical protein